LTGNTPPIAITSNAIPGNNRILHCPTAKCVFKATVLIIADSAIIENYSASNGANSSAPSTPIITYCAIVQYSNTFSFNTTSLIIIRYVITAYCAIVNSKIAIEIFDTTAADTGVTTYCSVANSQRT
jgi:hypothetical protein